MTLQGVSWLVRVDNSAQATGVLQGVEYHRVYAADKRRILRGIAAIAPLFAGLMILAQAYVAGAGAAANGWCRMSACRTNLRVLGV
jgi:hypothetical protein